MHREEISSANVAVLDWLVFQQLFTQRFLFSTKEHNSLEYHDQQ